AFFWIADQGYYAMILPGGLLGLGAGIVRNRSVLIAIVCGLLAIALGVFTEYRFAPFVADDSLPYFISHLFDLKPVTLLMIAPVGLSGLGVPCRGKEQRRSA